jgi:AraC-like DNA-binding protein
MGFNLYAPCDALKPYVKTLAISETGEERTYKVLPDTGLVMGFQYKGSLSYLDQGKEIRLNSSGLTGLNDGYRLFKNSADIGTVLVYFTETGASAFIKQPVHELFRESVSLENFMLHSEMMTLEEQIEEAKTDQGKIRVVERFLNSRITHIPTDGLVLNALRLIHQSRGNIRIHDLAEQLNTSLSPLEKRFRQKVGATPKKFASIVRLQYTIQNYQFQKSLTDLGYEAGFYDQAHFIKEFKTFTGQSPEDFFCQK